jgi:hypothetical protein
MALYDVPVHRGYNILTHTAHPLFLKNGFKQVGNTTLPANPISAGRVAPSAIYDKKIAGISEAGYGQRYPYRGLSYSGAGSPSTSVLRGVGYSGAGSPRASVLRGVRGVGYSGAGSPRTSVLRGLGYSGAGSPRTSVLRDAYINDNPAPGTLAVIPGFKQGTLKGLRDDPTVSPETDFGTPLPSANIWNDLTSAVGSIFSSAVSAGTQAGSRAVESAIQGAPPKPTTIIQTVRAAATGTTNVLGMAIPTTALLLGGGVLAYVMLRK